MQDRLWNDELFDEFCNEFVKEMNRLRMEYRAARTAAERELAQLEAKRKRFVDLLFTGAAHADDVRPQLDAIRGRRAELERQLGSGQEPSPPLLHPEMGRLCREWVTQARAALTEDDHRAGATTAIRAMVEDIVLTPAAAGGTLEILLKGDLAGMLVASGPNGEAEELQRQLSVVAGARNRRNLAAWWWVAA